jgi:hypothetical protein
MPPWPEGGAISVAGWQGDWVQGPDCHLVIRYACPEPDCDEFFDVKPGTTYKLRDELAARHSANHLVAEAENFLKSKGKQ